VDIQIDPHTLERAEERGASLAEIRETVEQGFPVPAKYGKKGKAKIFPFRKTWNGKHYEEKKVEVIYLRLKNKIVTVTVYVFYGKWGV
jgi:hypothetical protein